MNKAERLVAVEEEIAIARAEAARLRAGLGASSRPPVAQRHAPLASTVRAVDPAAPTPDDERVARQLGVSIDRVVAAKLERERESKRRPDGLTEDELRVARQVGVDPADLARTKASRT